MPSRILAQSSVLARVRLVALLFQGILLTACLVGTASAATPGGIPWQVGDVVVCYGGGNCNVLRIHGTSVQLLDTLSDGLLGNTGGVALNSSLHVVATDDKGGGSSKVVVYSIASVNPFVGTPLPHNVISTFDASGGLSPSAAAIAVNSAGHIFVGNASASGASIVELNEHGAAIAGSVFTFPTTGACGTTTLGSLDIGAGADFIYVTAKDGVIRKVSLPLSSATCSQFANFGSGVTLYGIKDIPASALSGFCTGSASCPAGESVLVVATGFTDPDALESGETSNDAVNICTNQADRNPVSCALLLNTSSNPGLTSPLWQAGTQYFTVGAAILDPFLHQQTVTSAGTSGADEPAFSQFGELTPVIDNAVIWTDNGQPGWTPNHAFAVAPFPGTYVVDSNLNLQTVTTTGISGPTQPVWSASSTTIDGLVWTDQGAWQANHTFPLGAAVGDAAGHPHTVLTAGTSGSSLPSWNDAGGVTIDNAVTWTNQGLVVPYSTSHPYALNTLIVASGHAQQAVEPGTSGGSTPNFSTSGGRTIDNAVTWTDQGQEFWHPSFAFPAGAVIVDPAGHVQQVTTAGTSGTTQPVFNDAGSTTTDNTVVWTDEGVLTWAANFNYAGTSAANTFVVDGANHIQRATISGTSGPAQPTFNDGGTTSDGANLVWTDQGQKFWYPNFVFATNAIVVDTAGHVQQVTTPGTSGPTQPTFNDAGGSVTDGLQWTDEGVPGTWAASTPYSMNAVILDGAGHVQQVITAGTSGSSQPSFNDSGSTTSDGTVVWQDRGTAGPWTASTPYGLNAVITDGASHVQQATAAGTSGAGPAPTFSSTGGTVSDNAVVWADQGPLSGNPMFTWQPTNPYSLNAQIVDPANHVQQVTVAGTSASSAPTFNDGGMVIDGLVWLDIGPTVSWVQSTLYTSGTLFVDPGSFLQEVTTTGISGTPAQPVWNESPTGTTIDGLQWTDQGHLVWQANHPFALGNLISDAATHVQKVTEAGTSGPGPAPAFSTIGGTTMDNAVIWTESHPSWLLNHQYVTGNTDTLILDPNHHVQLVSTSGISGPTVPPFTSGHPLPGQTIDGLQWSNQATPLTSVVARYPVTGVDTLQSLALDPLVANCTGNSCSSLPLPARKTANFWMGDSVSGNFYKLDFATGAPITFTGGCPTGCGIQSLVVYGGEGANQPGLASLVSNFTLNGVNFFTASAQFEQNSITSTLSNNGGGSPPPTPISLYASLVDKASCFNDPVVGNLACQATVQADTSKALVWKIDVPLNGTAGLPLTETLNSSFGPPGVFGVDNSTDVFVDEQFDDTTFVGTDPGTRSISVHSLHEVPNTSQTQSQCKFSSPLQNGCYKTNRNTLNFTFTCPGLSQTQFQDMHPSLSLVQKNPPQSPKFIRLTGTNGKAPFRFDSSGNFWTFQWNLNGATAGTYEGTAFDSPGPGDNPPVQSFTVTFNLKNSCP